jgi:hypothetical protein
LGAAAGAVAGYFAGSAIVKAGLLGATVAGLATPVGCAIVGGLLIGGLVALGVYILVKPRLKLGWVDPLTKPTLRRLDASPAGKATFCRLMLLTGDSGERRFIAEAWINAETLRQLDARQSAGLLTGETAAWAKRGVNDPEGMEMEIKSDRRRIAGSRTEIDQHKDDVATTRSQLNDAIRQAKRAFVARQMVLSDLVTHGLDAIDRNMNLADQEKSALKVRYLHAVEDQYAGGNERQIRALHPVDAFARDFLLQGDESDRDASSDYHMIIRQRGDDILRGLQAPRRWPHAHGGLRDADDDRSGL